MEQAHRTTANREIAEFGEKMLLQPMKYSNGNELDVRWQHGLLMGVSTRTNGIMMSDHEGNERA